MAMKSVTCPNCGNAAEINVGEPYVEGEAYGYECGGCGQKVNVPAQRDEAEIAAERAQASGQAEPPAAADPNAVAVSDGEQGTGATEITG